MAIHSLDPSAVRVEDLMKLQAMDDKALNTGFVNFFIEMILRYGWEETLQQVTNFMDALNQSNARQELQEVQELRTQGLFIQEGLEDE